MHAMFSYVGNYVAFMNSYLIWLHDIVQWLDLQGFLDSMYQVIISLLDILWSPLSFFLGYYDYIKFSNSYCLIIMGSILTLIAVSYICFRCYVIRQNLKVDEVLKEFERLKTLQETLKEK